MYRMTLFLVYSVFIVISLVGCSDDTVQPYEISNTYDSLGYTSATLSEQDLIKSHIDFVNLLKTGRINGTIIEYSSALAAMQFHLPESSDSLKVSFPLLLQELSKASGGTYDPFSANQGQGGTYGEYLFDENGLEIEQILDKTAFMGLFYHKAAKLPITNELPHKLTALFGASPRFSNSNIAVDSPDILSAGYAARRDKNDGKGIYTEFKQSVIAIQGFQKRDSQPANDLLNARKRSLLAWEKAIMSTVVHYCFSAHAKLIGTNPTANDNGAALHAIAENIGFIIGLKAVSEKKITNAQIDQLFALFKANKPSVFVTDAFTNAPDLLEAITMIKTIYGFTDQEIEDFKVNWVTIQNRK